MPRPVLNILNTAMRLYYRGLWIVPCDGKKPIWPEWHSEKRSREEVTEALEGSKLNIAIVLNQSDWIDVECDTPEAEDNLQAIFGGVLPLTPT